MNFASHTRLLKGRELLCSLFDKRMIYVLDASDETDFHDGIGTHFSTDEIQVYSDVKND